MEHVETQQQTLCIKRYLILTKDVAQMCAWNISCLFYMLSHLQYSIIAFYLPYFFLFADSIALFR
jgi:hypothetical protein